MSASNTPNLKAQFEDQYACPEPSVNESAIGGCCSCDDYSCNDEFQ